MYVSCPKCEIEYNIESIIPKRSNGVIVCSVCSAQFNIKKIVNNNEVNISVSLRKATPSNQQHHKPIRISVNDAKQLVIKANVNNSVLQKIKSGWKFFIHHIMML